MKHQLTAQDLHGLTSSEQQFFTIWMQRKGYTILTIGHLIEFLIGFSFNFHQEFSDGRFFNYILLNKESSISWEGDSLCDILFFESKSWINYWLKKSSVFHDTANMV